MKSEVDEMDGKLLTAVGGIDVSKVLVERPYLRDDMYYKFLGLPELPEIPRWCDYPSPPHYNYREVKKLFIRPLGLTHESPKKSRVLK